MMVQSRSNEVSMSVLRVLAINIVLLASAGLVSSACGGEEPAPSEGSAGAGATMCGTCTEPDATVDLTMPVVSFRNDIFNTFLRGSCSSLTCHGVALASATALYPGAMLHLGPPPDKPAPADTEISTIVAALKAASKTAPAMKIVEPGNEAASFLIAKIHGCQNERGQACTQQSVMLIRCDSNPCGDVMPPVDQITQLTADQKNTFRRWVAQGALDN
jgi:hypothetical protein